MKKHSLYLVCTSLISTFILIVTLLIPAQSFAGFTPASLRNFRNNNTTKKFVYTGPEEVKVINKQFSGTISAIKGNNITIDITDPEKGEPTKLVVHTEGSKITRTATKGPKLLSKKSKGASDHAVSGGKETKKTRPLVTVSSLLVGDLINVGGTLNDDGTLNASRVMAHAPQKIKIETPN